MSNLDLHRRSKRHSSFLPPLNSRGNFQWSFNTGLELQVQQSNGTKRFKHRKSLQTLRFLLRRNLPSIHRKRKGRSIKIQAFQNPKNPSIFL